MSKSMNQLILEYFGGKYDTLECISGIEHEYLVQESISELELRMAKRINESKSLFDHVVTGKRWAGGTIKIPMLGKGGKNE